MEYTQAVQLAKESSDSLGYSLKFCQTDLTSSLKACSEVSVELSFINLNPEKATKIIPSLRDVNAEFSLQFKSLTPKNASSLIKNAHLEEESIEIPKVKKLNDLFTKQDAQNALIDILSLRGYEYLLEMNEKGFVPWWDVTAVLALAGLQMVCGTALIATGIGANVGMGMITEGATDIFTGYRAYRSRRFNWTDYKKQKVVSLAISAASCGFQSLKDAAKGLKNWVWGAGVEVMEQTIARSGQKAFLKGGDLLKNFKALQRKLYKDAGWQIALKTSEAGARELLNHQFDKFAQFVLEDYRRDIANDIEDRVRRELLTDPELTKLLQKFNALDRFSQSNQLNAKTQEIVGKLMDPENIIGASNGIALDNHCLRGFCQPLTFISVISLPSPG